MEIPSRVRKGLLDAPGVIAGYSSQVLDVARRVCLAAVDLDDPAVLVEEEARGDDQVPPVIEEVAEEDIPARQGLFFESKRDGGFPYFCQQVSLAVGDRAEVHRGDEAAGAFCGDLRTGLGKFREAGDADRAVA